MKREEDELTFSIPSPPFLFLAAKKEERTLTPHHPTPPKKITLTTPNHRFPLLLSLPFFVFL